MQQLLSSLCFEPLHAQHDFCRDKLTQSLPFNLRGCIFELYYAFIHFYDFIAVEINLALGLKGFSGQSLASMLVVIIAAVLLETDVAVGFLVQGLNVLFNATIATRLFDSLRKLLLIFFLLFDQACCI